MTNISMNPVADATPPKLIVRADSVFAPPNEVAAEPMRPERALSCIPPWRKYLSLNTGFLEFIGRSPCLVGILLRGELSEMAASGFLW